MLVRGSVILIALRHNLFSDLWETSIYLPGLMITKNPRNRKNSESMPLNSLVALDTLCRSPAMMIQLESVSGSMFQMVGGPPRASRRPELRNSS